mmetsp:Transcript_65079/g.172378  ORF Transcript_65079/g.172378 Transcript_65079/m.172378 type:complete len:256 (-) Transcript_65079:597-1364(-)
MERRVPRNGACGRHHVHVPSHEAFDKGNVADPGGTTNQRSGAVFDSSHLRTVNDLLEGAAVRAGHMDRVAVILDHHTGLPIVAGGVTEPNRSARSERRPLRCYSVERRLGILGCGHSKNNDWLPPRVLQVGFAEYRRPKRLGCQEFLNTDVREGNALPVRFQGQKPSRTRQKPQRIGYSGRSNNGSHRGQLNDGAATPVGGKSQRLHNSTKFPTSRNCSDCGCDRRGFATAWTSVGAVAQQTVQRSVKTCSHCCW